MDPELKTMLLQLGEAQIQTQKAIGDVAIAQTRTEKAIGDLAQLIRGQSEAADLRAQAADLRLTRIENDLSILVRALTPPSNGKRDK